MNLTTVARVKQFKDLGTSETAPDAEIARLIPAASKFICDYCERIFDGAEGLVEYQSGQKGQILLRVQRPPLRTLTSIHDDPDRVYGADTLIDAEDYAIDNAAAGLIRFDGTTLSEGIRNLKLVYDGGFLPLDTPAAPTVTPQGTSGATAYSYKVVAFDQNGETDASAAGSTATGHATPSSTNFNRITWATIAGAEGYRIYRTAGGATQGIIGSVYSGATLQFDDTGLTADSSTAPTINSTGIPPDIEQAAIELVWLAREKGNLSLLGFRSKGVADGSFSMLDNEWPAGVKSILDSYCLPSVP